MTVDDIPAADWATLDREFFAYVARNEWKLGDAFKPKADRGPNVSRYPHVPAGPIIRYAKTVREQLHPRRGPEPPHCELLWRSADPHEIPLVLPGWARKVPQLADAIDRGLEIRRSAGLPTGDAAP